MSQHTKNLAWPIGLVVTWLHLVVGAGVVSTTSCGNPDEGVIRIQRIGEGRVASAAEVRFLLERLDAGSAEERLSAAWALGQVGSISSMPALTVVANDDANTDVRINAIAALGELGGASVETTLLGFLEDEDAQIQAAALRGLAGSRDAEIVPRVGEVVVHGGDATRALAVDVLGSIGDASAIPFLAQVTDDPDPDARSRIAFALGKLRDPSALPSLMFMLEDDQWEVRANAVQALGMIGDPSALSAIESMTDDPNSLVGQTAEAALEKLR